MTEPTNADIMRRLDALQAIVAPNPMSSDIDWAQVESTLGVKIIQGAPEQMDEAPSVVNLMTENRDLLLKCSDARELPIDDLGQVIDELRVLLQHSRDLARKLDMVDIGDGHVPSSTSVASTPPASTASTAAATADAPEDTGEAGSSRPASPDLAAAVDRLAAAIQKLEARVKSMHLSAKRGRPRRLPLHRGGVW